MKPKVFRPSCVIGGKDGSGMMTPFFLREDVVSNEFVGRNQIKNECFFHNRGFIKRRY
jgi:hypothetical protein